MVRSQRERLWLMAGGAVAFFLVLVGYFFFVSPQNGQTHSAQSQVANARSHNSALQVRINQLQQQNKNLATYQQALQQAKLALPDTSGLADFLRTLQSMGNATLADVTSLTVGAPTDLTAAAGAKKPATTGSSSSAASGASAPAPKVYALPISAQISGTQAQLNEFLTQLQNVQPRAVLISELNQTSGNGGGSSKSGSGQLNIQLTMQAFVAPVSSAESAALAAAAH